MDQTDLAPLGELLRTPSAKALADLFALLGGREGQPGFGATVDRACAMLASWPPELRVLPAHDVERFAAYAADGWQLRLATRLDLRGFDYRGSKPLTELLAPSHFPQRLVQIQLQRTPLTLAALEQMLGAPACARLTGLCLGENRLLDDRAVELIARSAAALGSLTQVELPNDCTAAAARALAASPHLRGWTHLFWRCAQLGADGAQALAGAAHLSSLEVLDLTQCNLGDDGVHALLRSPHLRPRILDVEGNDAGDRAALALAAQDGSRLRRLRFGSATLGDAGVIPLVRSAALAHLTHLDLAQGAATLASVEALAGAPSLTNLRSLRLSGASLGDEALELLARSPHLGGLRRLTLEAQGITARGALALARSPSLRALEVLQLRGNRLGSAGLAALAASPGLAHLVELDVSENAAGDEGAAALAESSLAGQLVCLNLHANPIADAPVAALVGRAAALASLDLGSTSVTTATARAIAAAPHLVGLRSLDLSGTGIDVEGCRVLSEARHLASLHTLLVTVLSRSMGTMWLGTSPVLAAPIRDHYAYSIEKKQLAPFASEVGVKIPTKLRLDEALERIRAHRGASA